MRILHCLTTMLLRTPLLVMLALFTMGCFNTVQVAPTSTSSGQTENRNMKTFHTLEATDIHGAAVTMSVYAGKKVMVVNTASECGYTPQYKQLQELHEQYRDKGLVILGFPCNDFGGQEPGTEAQIEQFCQKNYGVTFPLMGKVSITGNAPSPIYQWLTTKALNGAMDASVKWNFHKFLIDEEGRLVKSLGSSIEPFDEEVIGWLNS